MPKCPQCQLVYKGKMPHCPGCGASLAAVPLESDEAAQHETKVMQSFFDMARNISSTLDLDMLLKKIGSSAERLINAEASSIMLKIDNDDQLYFKTASGERSQEIRLMKVPIGKGIAGWVAKERKPLVVNDVDSDKRFTRDFDKASGFHTRSILCVPMVVDDEMVGVVEVLNKVGKDGFNEEDLKLLQSLSGLAAVAVTNVKLVERQKNFFANVIELLVAAIESKDPQSQGHAYRITQLACAIARRLNIEGAAYKDLYYASLLHDIGVLGVGSGQVMPRTMQANTSLSPHAMHPIVGAEMLKNITLLKNAGQIIRHHHEYFDGSGYPDKLRSDQIPIGSRILCLLEDIEDVKQRVSNTEQYFSEIEKLAKAGSSSKYDPRVVRAFLEESKNLRDSML